MPHNLKRPGQARAASTLGQPLAQMDGWVNTGPALLRSEVTRLHGRLYSVQFREQGAVEAWKRALENTLL
ncbi:hypothetical protein [Massilia brevitalea]|uniref:hypothetical protein n=1 Tax=Massilia brevitalea TaxID=442526 RepID=UPI00273847C1|nr:hypothetical protein [Massilia brevitalea]